MIPAWVWTILVVVVGGITALWLGSYLPEMGMDPMAELIMVVFAACCVIGAIINDFPFLFAFGSWFPFFPHFGASSLETVFYFMAWMALILFFRLCMQGYLSYRQSFNWFILIVFAWVPIRFLMNPVTHLGGTAGGSGVSGALPYFNYCLAAVLTIFVGAILTDRTKIMHFMRWCLVITFFSGCLLTICAFIPAATPILVNLGAYNAGEMGDGITRYVELPGYGLFVLEASLCPALFRLKRWLVAILFPLGLFMIILGGNRSALIAALIAIPVMLFLRRRVGAMLVSFCLVCICVLVVRVSVDNSAGKVPPLLRSLGVFDSKIDKSTGGDVSAEWRYEMWADAWKKIMEHPLTGKGFGHLPQHMEGGGSVHSTDFETAVAGGEAHNGFVTAAYGFGIPFMVALSVILVLFLFKEAFLALHADKHDPEMLELHAFLAGMFASYPVLIYTGLDLSIDLIWSYVALSCLLGHLPRREYEQISSAGSTLRKYGEEPRPAGGRYYTPTR